MTKSNKLGKCKEGISRFLLSQKEAGKLLVTTSQREFKINDVCDFSKNDFSATTSLDRIYKKHREVNWCNIVILCYSIISYIFDVGSDCYLLMVYHKEKDRTWFILTLVFIIVPAVIMSIMSIFSYCEDKITRFTRIGWLIRVLFHCLLVAPIVRYVDTLIYAWKSKKSKNEEKTRYYLLMIYEEADAVMLRMIECTMEAAPQLLLQSYKLFTQHKVSNPRVVHLQILSSILSLISMAWCFATYQSCQRLISHGRTRMNLKSRIPMFLWRFFALLPRFISIVLFTSVFKLYILILIGSHYLIMVIYIIGQGTNFISTVKYTFKEILFDLVLAFILCIDFLNIKEGVTRVKYILFYTISFTEICVMIILWFLHPPYSLKLPQNYNLSLIYHYNSSQSNYFYQAWPIDVRFYVVIATVLSFIISMMLMMIYYIWCHPSKDIQISLDKGETVSTVVKQPEANYIQTFRPEEPSLGFQLT